MISRRNLLNSAGACVLVMAAAQALPSFATAATLSPYAEVARLVEQAFDAADMLHLDVEDRATMLGINMRTARSAALVRRLALGNGVLMKRLRLIGLMSDELERRYPGDKIAQAQELNRSPVYDWQSFRMLLTGNEIDLHNVVAMLGCDVRSI